MITKKFSSALGNIGEEYINEAIMYTAKNNKKSRVKWSAIAACFSLILISFTVILSYVISDNSPPTGDNNFTMIFTEAKIIEVNSTKSFLVEITNENVYKSNTEKNLFAVGERIQAMFNEEISLSLVPGDVVIIGRGNTAKVDYSQKPYIVPCNSIKLKASEDYRNIKVGVENGEGATEAGFAFVNQTYGEHLINLQNDNPYQILEYKLIEYTQIEIGSDYVLGSFTFALKPTNVSSYSSQFATVGSGEFEGWLILSKTFRLQRINTTYWNCTQLESIPPDTLNK